MSEKCDNCEAENEAGFKAGYDQAEQESQDELTQKELVNENLEIEVDRLKDLLSDIEGIAEGA